MKSIWLPWALLGIAPSVAISDGYYRCGNGLVSSDTSVAELLKKCGAPSSKQVSIQDVWGPEGRKIGTTRVETWRYDRGSRAAAIIVTVIDGKIEKMESGPLDEQPGE